MLLRASSKGFSDDGEELSLLGETGRPYGPGV